MWGLNVQSCSSFLTLFSLLFSIWSLTSLLNKTPRTQMFGSPYPLLLHLLFAFQFVIAFSLSSFRLSFFFFTSRSRSDGLKYFISRKPACRNSSSVSSLSISFISSKMGRKIFQTSDSEDQRMKRWFKRLLTAREANTWRIRSSLMRPIIKLDCSVICHCSTWPCRSISRCSRSCLLLASSYRWHPSYTPQPCRACATRLQLRLFLICYLGRERTGFQAEGRALFFFMMVRDTSLREGLNGISFRELRLCSSCLVLMVRWCSYSCSKRELPSLRLWWRVWSTLMLMGLIVGWKEHPSSSLASFSQLSQISWFIFSLIRLLLLSIMLCFPAFRTIYSLTSLILIAANSSSGFHHLFRCPLGLQLPDCTLFDSTSCSGWLTTAILEACLASSLSFWDCQAKESASR